MVLAGGGEIALQLNKKSEPPLKERSGSLLTDPNLHSLWL
jgi:hypothetical protein